VAAGDPAPPVDFRTALSRQLHFLSASCRSFDEGFHDEAIRIAQCIRVLMHDTRNQRSLLRHLNSKSIMLTSSCLDIRRRIQPGQRALFFNGMALFGVVDGAGIYQPKLANGFNYELSVEEWWQQSIFILDAQTWVSRSDVVLAAADKDGGAHVDARLTPEYERLIKGGDLGYFIDEHGNETPLDGNHFVALRQMGWELLNSPALLALAVG
jgi:hypothetical protein